MKHIHEHKYNITAIAGIILFLIISLFIAPFTHELFHLIVLKANNCQYWTDFHTSLFKGMYASIYQTCTLTQNTQILLYLAGVVGNLIVSLLLLLWDFWLTKRKHIELSNIILFSSLGFLTDPIIYLFNTNGDIYNALKLLNKPYLIKYLPITGLIILSLSFAYMLYTLTFLEDMDLIEKEIKFLKKLEKKDKKHRFKKLIDFLINLSKHIEKINKKRKHKKYMPK